MPQRRTADDDPGRGARLGRSVLEARTRRRIGVRELARMVDVSASLISRIEKGTVMPSVGTLYALAEALEVPVAEILGDDVPGADAPEGGGPPRGFGAGRSPAHGVQRRDTRDILDLDADVRWERLTPGPDPLQFVYSVYRPGGASSPDGEYLRHSGREYGYVVSGRLGVTLGFETTHLEAGDSIAFDSSVPHRLFNDGDGDAVMIWVAVPWTFSDP